MRTLEEKLAKVLEAHRARLQALHQQHGSKIVDQVTVDQILGGARGIKALICDTSRVPPDKGLIVRGRPIGELTGRLPEEVFFLLLTGELPEPALLAEFRAVLAERHQVPAYVWNVIDALPADSHPMCMLNTAILCMERESVFRKRYDERMSKDEFWKATLQDALTLLARLPSLAAWVYRKRFQKGARIEPDPKKDWGGNFAHMLGLPDPNGEFSELVRLFLVLHADHDCGNVSAMTCSVVNSALSDLYYSLCASLNGLAGPLHGLANQECLAWVQETIKRNGGVPTAEQITKQVEADLAARRVIPGYGHAVLRVVDPRFTAFMEFGKKHCAGDPLFQTVQRVFEVVPNVLKQKSRAANPWPNVDAASGALLHHYGLVEPVYYTVLFAVSRALGVCSQALIARGTGLPIFRPASVTTEWLEQAVKGP